MKNIYKILSILCLISYQSFTLTAKSTSAVGINPYTLSPEHFETEDGIMGYYWKGNENWKYPGKAFINDVEYKNILVLPEGQSPKKYKKLLYLGTFVRMTVDQNGNNISTVYNLYGKPAIIVPTYNGPDADVVAFQKEREVPFESDEEHN